MNLICSKRIRFVFLSQYVYFNRCMIGGMVTIFGTTSIRWRIRDKVQEIHAILSDGSKVVLTKLLLMRLSKKKQKEIR
jgi:hypothetical protein